MQPQQNPSTPLDIITNLHTQIAQPHLEPDRVAQMMRQLLEVSGLSAPTLARHLEVAPQTVHRWCSGTAMPRPKQIQKLERWFTQGEEAGRAEVPEAVPRQAPESLKYLGIRFADEVLALEAEARAVWIVKSGTLREEVRGSIGEAVLRGLKHGTRFHYLFLEGTPAASSFQQLSRWLEGESFAGQVTGYRVGDNHVARAVGLTDAPGAWIGIEYTDEQAARMQRRFDVFFAVGAREYTDATRSQVKNEDGQPCWIELATPLAARWLSTVAETVDKFEKLGRWHSVEILQLPPK
jgi:transcriptional regulator with XRE-family HTH domain